MTEPNNFTLRGMTKKDIADIHRLEKLCFKTPWSQEAFRGELKNQAAHYLVLCDGERIAAYGGMWVMFDEAHVTNVGVDPEYRRMGLGERLMRSLMRSASQMGATAMTLEVRAGNIAAQELYSKLGFERAGVRRGYYADTQEDALILWNNKITEA